MSPHRMISRSALQATHASDTKSQLPERHWFMAALVVISLLTGCTTQPIQTREQAPADWAQRQQVLSHVENWKISGKLGVRQGDRIDSAVINSWSQRGAEFDINLSSAVFGLGATNLRGTPHSIWLTQSGKEPLYSDQPESLIYQQTGWTLPIESLFSWIKGIPAPTRITDSTFDLSGRLYELQQLGWTIRYTDYHDTEPYPLPRKIILTRESVRVTLVINDWQLDGVSP